MDFQKLLLDVANALSEEEVNALVFLCTDLLNQNLKSVKSASDLFSKLIDQGRLSAEDPQLLTELLSTIQRHRLLRGLHLPSPECRTRLISPYRTLLYQLSEDITAQELKDIKFILGQDVPRRKLEDHVTTLEIFLEMERRDLLSDTNLNKLEYIIRTVHPALCEKINRFKEQQAHETGRPRSSSVPSTSNPSLGSIRSTGSFDTADLPAAHASINSASTSLDFHKRTEKCEPETHGIGSLVITPSQENNASAQTKNETLGTYPMASAKRGVCAIVNNYDFSKSQRQRQREGTMVDEKSLRTVFEWLGFQVLTYTDCDGGKILSVLRELSKRDHSQMDCLVVCVLSHGHQGNVCGVDGQAVALEDLTEPFDGPECPSLAGKPKLFFIQACQGNKEQRPVEIDGDLCADARPNKDFIPSGADFLLGMATVPSYVSFRHKKTGTWYIQSLCQNLVEMVPSQVDLVSILTKVNADVSRMSDPYGQKKQMPQPAFTLRQKVVFPVPKDPPPSLQD
ncbi:unnamed protein product [Menidia menidia]|uniref:Caspase-8 n=1 Tax=Menidia menidia TaxID=238744 RepID=A0A8S4AFJ0_9TELE|nr:unnamed protein product [Menidia menidia]